MPYNQNKTNYRTLFARDKTNFYKYVNFVMFKFFVCVHFLCVNYVKVLIS